MNLLELALRNNTDTKAAEGAKIPWNDPDFSRRMLENHLAQDHNWASRRQDIIARHTSWIAGQLSQKPSRILDLGCGPGLYTLPLAQMGHDCVGVDFSPASIAHAREQAAIHGQSIDHLLCDIRNFKSPQAFDCIIMTFGEFNVFTRQDAEAILRNCAGMLKKDGLFILEAHTHEAVRAIGSMPAAWQRQTKGLFSDEPHLCLQENSWNASDASALSRFFIIDAASADVTHYASFMQAYTQEDYGQILKEAALPITQVVDAEAWPSGEEFGGKLQVFICRKQTL